MTTDTVPKTASTTFTAGSVEHHVGGMAKGSGMLHPNMATLLAFVTTDADVAATDLQSLLGEVADSSFNCVTVDGDTSTNDSLIALANGAAGGPVLVPGTDDFAALRTAFLDVCESLAEQIVADAEGRPSISGCPSPAPSTWPRRGSPPAPWPSPRWSRPPCTAPIPTGAGSSWPWDGSGARFSLDRCRVDIAGVTVFERGGPVETDLVEVSEALRQPRIDIAVDLGAGDGSGHAWGCDLTDGYVRINADYTT